jgi:hypothetical protein
MRVLMTSDTYLPEIGGAEYHIYYLKKYLEKNDVHVKLLVTCNQIPSHNIKIYGHYFLSQKYCGSTVKIVTLFIVTTAIAFLR